MTHLLIIEANTPNLPAAARWFRDAFLAIDPAVTFATVAPYVTAAQAQDFDGVDGVIFTGSGVAWSTDDARAAAQRDAMTLAFETGLPVWGSCNGMQLAATVLGGTVGASPKGLEVGVAQNTRLTDAGKAHSMYAGRNDTFAVPCIHRDEVQTLPVGATLLAGNDHSPIQAFAHDKDGVDYWGTQYHPELRPTHIADFIRNKDGIFGSRAELIVDLDCAETDPVAAARLGTTTAALLHDIRTIELSNWLTHAKNKASIRKIRGSHPDAEIFTFGDGPALCDRLNDLVVSGAKTATCGALRDFGPTGEAMPRVGRHDIATDWSGKPVALIRTVSVETKRFDQVTWDFAQKEGENDDLAGWRADHRAFFERNGGFDPQMDLVCETFELVRDLRD